MLYFYNLDSPELTGSETRHDISDIEGLPRPPFLPVIYYKLNYSQSLGSLGTRRVDAYLMKHECSFRQVASFAVLLPEAKKDV